MIDTRDGYERLLAFLPGRTLPQASLAELTGDAAKANAGRWPSGLARRIADAWTIPTADLTCGQCRMLVGQRLGLQWLADPVTRFVVDYPQAECDLYPGDMTVIALIVWRDLATYAQEGTRSMLAQDYEWLRREARQVDWHESIVKQAIAALDAASDP